MRPTVMIVIAALAASCVRFNVKFSGEGSSGRRVVRKPADAVAVFTIPPGRTFVEIGHIDIVATGFLSPYESAVAEMRREAGERGCDALVIAPSPNGRQYSAACIVYGMP